MVGLKDMSVPGSKGGENCTVPSTLLQNVLVLSHKMASQWLSKPVQKYFNDSLDIIYISPRFKKKKKKIFYMHFTDEADESATKTKTLAYWTNLKTYKAKQSKRKMCQAHQPKAEFISADHNYS